MLRSQLALSYSGGDSAGQVPHAGQMSGSGKLLAPVHTCGRFWPDLGNSEVIHWTKNALFVEVKRGKASFYLYTCVVRVMFGMGEGIGRDSAGF